MTQVKKPGPLVTEQDQLDSTIERIKEKIQKKQSQNQSASSAYPGRTPPPVGPYPPKEKPKTAVVPIPKESPPKKKESSSTTKGSNTQDSEKLEKDTSHQSVKDPASRRSILVSQVKKLLGKQQKILWFYSMMLYRTGAGGITKFPKDLHEAVLVGVKKKTSDEEWLGEVIDTLRTYDRVWAPAPVARYCVLQASFESWGEHSHKEAK